MGMRSGWRRGAVATVTAGILLAAGGAAVTLAQPDKGTMKTDEMKKDGMKPGEMKKDEMKGGMKPGETKAGEKMMMKDDKMKAGDTKDDAMPEKK